ncbi:hypothetical protein BGZ67_001991, partial [Mortierella alpina]
TSHAFPVKVSLDDTVGDLKKLIKSEQAPAFDDITANSLTLWKVSIPIVADKHKAILLDSLEVKDDLDPRDDIAAVFDVDPEIAALRKQLSDVFDSSF